MKSFLGSNGVSLRGFPALSANSNEREFNQYRIFNDEKVRNGIITEVFERYGYSRESIQIKLFVGKFSAGAQETIEHYLNHLEDRGVRFGVVALDQIVRGLLEKAKESTYMNDPVIMTVKALEANGKLPKTTTLS